MTAYEQRSYPGAAADTVLTADLALGGTAFSVTTGTGAGYPDGTGGPFFVIIDYDNSKAEKIRCSGRVNDTFTVAGTGGGRGQDGTTAVAHPAPAKVRAVWTATDAQETNRAAVQTVGKVTTKGDLLTGSGANTLARTAAGADGTLVQFDSTQPGGVKATSGAITGAPVGTTDAQTLTNKTLTAPVIGDHTNAGHSHASAAGGGTLVQSSTHGSPDTDVASTSLHHTIGAGAAQAAAGNHGHGGVYANNSHTHAEADVTSLVTDLGNKSAVGHTHVNADVTNLASASVSHADTAGAVTWTNVSGKPLNKIAGGQVTVTFSGGLATYAHGMGTSPTAAVVQKTDGGNDGTVIGFNGPTAWDATNLYLRCSTGTTGFSGGYTFAWIAFA